MWSRDNGRATLGVSEGVIAFILRFKLSRNIKRHSRIFKCSATPFWWSQLSNNLVRFSIIKKITVNNEAQKQIVIRDIG